jgi:glycosyltransferase involved in cell wall biosynthesis
VHNLFNHEKRRVWLDRLNSVIVGKQAHKVFVHGKSAIPIINKEFSISSKKIFVVHHGNYNGIITPRPYNLVGKGIVHFLFFGVIRKYKGIPELLDAFLKLHGQHKLHIAGKITNVTLKKQIEEKSRTDDRINLSLNFISDEELEDLLHWCNVVVLPFNDTFTSGSLLMAMTAGRPIIAPNIGLIPEYVDNQCAFLYDPCEPDALLNALKKATETSNLQDMARKSFQQAQKYQWNEIGFNLMQKYQE